MMMMCFYLSLICFISLSYNEQPKENMAWKLLKFSTKVHLKDAVATKLILLCVDDKR